MKLFETVSTPAPNIDVVTASFKPPCTGIYRSGYGGYTKWSYITITLFNVILASALLLPALPVILALAAAIKLRDNGPIFYRGVRLGLNKQTYFMYKFRTLPVGSQTQLGDQLFSETIQHIDSFSRFLRDTRLDELPQLFNVLKGDMDFVGPRPERPEIYNKFQSTIPNYDFRFTVRPGLIGFSQLFTPHSSPKRLRALIDNRYICTKRILFWDLIIVIFTFGILLREVFVKGSSLVYRQIFLDRILGRFSEKRKLERIMQNFTELHFNCENRENFPQKSSVIDMNEGYCKIQTEQKLDEHETPVVFVAHTTRKKQKKSQKNSRHGQGL
ncbi:MAG: sugar transferase [Pseudomonadota bacterium]